MAQSQPDASTPTPPRVGSPSLPVNGSSPNPPRSSPAPPSVDSSNARSKRTKRDSRKKREANGLDVESSAPPTKKRAAALTQNSAVPSSDLTLLRPLLLAEPRASDLFPPQPRQLSFVARKSSEVIDQDWDFYEVVDKLTNKNGFRYSYAIADPLFRYIKYRETDLYPYHARFSFEDAPAAFAFTKDALAVTTDDPWHTARSNVCAREGAFYYEARVISGIVDNNSSSNNNASSGSSSRGHVRLGFARREADLDVNVGVDCYGYGIRDVNGEVVNRMRCGHFFPKGESVCEGDVIGMLITLPPLSLHKKVVEGTYDPAAGEEDHDSISTSNIIRDRVPFHYRSDFCWQQSNVFPSKQLRDYAFNLKETPAFGAPSPLNSEDPSLRTLPDSSITVYKNGVKMGTPFQELYAFLPPASRFANGTNNLGLGERENADDGMIGYYPAVSCFGGGAVECRFEPPWWIGPPPHTDNGEPVRAFGERFYEHIGEDVLADIIDEVEAMCTWGDVAGDIVGGSGDPFKENAAAGEARMPLNDITVNDEGASSAYSGPSHTAVDDANGGPVGTLPVGEAAVDSQSPGVGAEEVSHV